MTNETFTCPICPVCKKEHIFKYKDFYDKNLIPLDYKEGYLELTYNCGDSYVTMCFERDDLFNKRTVTRFGEVKNASDPNVILPEQDKVFFTSDLLFVPLNKIDNFCSNSIQLTSGLETAVMRPDEHKEFLESIYQYNKNAQVKEFKERGRKSVIYLNKPGEANEGLQLLFLDEHDNNALEKILISVEEYMNNWLHEKQKSDKNCSLPVYVYGSVKEIAKLSKILEERVSMSKADKNSNVDKIKIGKGLTNNQRSILYSHEIKIVKRNLPLLSEHQEFKDFVKKRDNILQEIESRYNKIDRAKEEIKETKQKIDEATKDNAARISLTDLQIDINNSNDPALIMIKSFIETTRQQWPAREAEIGEAPDSDTELMEKLYNYTSSINPAGFNFKALNVVDDEKLDVIKYVWSCAFRLEEYNEAVEKDRNIKRKKDRLTRLESDISDANIAVNEYKFNNEKLNKQIQPVMTKHLLKHPEYIFTFMYENYLPEYNSNIKMIVRVNSDDFDNARTELKKQFKEWKIN